MFVTRLCIAHWCDVRVILGLGFYCQIIGVFDFMRHSAGQVYDIKVLQEWF